MKKALVFLVSFAVVVVAFGVDYTPVTEEVAPTVVSLTSTGDVTIDGKYAVVGGDATTGLMVQASAVTAVGTLETNSFAVAFGSAPVVTVSYTEDPGDVRPIFLGTVTASNFICTVASSKNYAYTAVGARP